MRKFASWAKIDEAVQKTLDKIADEDKSKAWDRKRKAVIAFKKAIHEHGMEVQEGRCAWCTLALGREGRRTVHRDHIAPKGLYSQWTFTAQNLILACEFCNGFSVKADLDTVRTVGDTYDKSDFLIVHPYFHEPSEHIAFSGSDGNDGILAVGKSDIGLWTIANLQLDSSGLTKERIKDYLYAKQVKSVLPAYYLDLFDRVTGRKTGP